MGHSDGGPERGAPVSSTGLGLASPASKLVAKSVIGLVPVLRGGCDRIGLEKYDHSHRVLVGIQRLPEQGENDPKKANEYKPDDGVRDDFAELHRSLRSHRCPPSP